MLSLTPMKSKFVLLVLKEHISFLLLVLGNISTIFRPYMSYLMHFVPCKIHFKLYIFSSNKKYPAGVFKKTNVDNLTESSSQTTIIISEKHSHIFLTSREQEHWNM